MAAYTFETITPAQALAFSSTDSVTVSSGSARNTTVLFQADGTYSVTIADRTVVFGSEFRFTGSSRLTFADGSQLYIGSEGSDARDFGSALSTGAMYAGAGNDTLGAGAGAWLMQGNQGNDRIAAYSTYSNTIYGGQDNDTISLIFGGTGGLQFMQGNKGDDTLQGGFGTDTLLGGQGNDVVNGTDGQDFINGNLGNDDLRGGGQLFGEGGNDTIVTSAGVASTASGGDGNDRIGIGSDGSATRNTVTGDAGNDTLTALSDTADDIRGGDGNDLIQITQSGDFGAVNADKVLSGDAGDDTVVGRGGREGLFGGAGRDSLNGGGGNDSLHGSDGADTLSGGSGSDRFEIAMASGPATLAEADRILDWSVEDRISVNGADRGYAYTELTAADFAGGLTAAQEFRAGAQGTSQPTVVAVQVGADVVLYWANSASIEGSALLVGRSLADISASNLG